MAGELSSLWFSSTNSQVATRMGYGEDDTITTADEDTTNRGTQRFRLGTFSSVITRFARSSDSETMDPYTKFSAFHELARHPSYANTIAGAAEDYQGYNILDTGSSNSSNGGSGNVHVDFTTVSNNETLAGLLNGNDTQLPALVSLTYPSMPAMVIVGTLLIGLAVATAFGNFLVGLALFKYKNLRSVSNYLIGNLACSDFLLAMTILPLSAVQECLGHWVFGKVMCYFWLCTDVLYCTASIWNLCIIAFDRFTATLYPMWYREKRSPKQAAIYISIVWVFSIAICIPPLLGWNDLSGSYKYDPKYNVHQCILFQSFSYVIYSAMGSFYIPFLLTVFLYIRIFGVLYMRMNKMKQAQKARKATQARLTAQAPPTVNPITAEATNPLCGKGDIEMCAVASAPAAEGGSGNTEEHSSKSLFGSESEDDSSSNNPPHHKHHAPPPPHHHQHQQDDSSGIHNGKVQHKQHKEQGDKSETMVILNTNHNFPAESEKDDIKIVVCPEKNGKNNNTHETAITGNDGNTSDNKKHMSSKLKPVGGKIKATTSSGVDKKKKRGSAKRKQDQREMRATIRMAIIIAFFCGCWIGFFTSYLVRGIIGDENFYMPRSLDAFFFWLGYSNSAMNPILYTIFNDDFRRAFQKILGCYSNRRHGTGHAYGKARS